MSVSVASRNQMSKLTGDPPLLIGLSCNPTQHPVFRRGFPAHNQAIDAAMRLQSMNSAQAYGSRRVVRRRGTLCFVYKWSGGKLEGGSPPARLSWHRLAPANVPNPLLA